MSKEHAKWVNFRQKLHQHPEVSEKEENTSRTTYKELEKLQPDLLIQNIGGYGIIAGFGNGDGKTIALRSELDALPIQEVSELPYRSEIKGTGHMCGHDGHTSILMATAEYFSHNRPAKGQVLFIFQPAEENGVGAEAMLNDEKWTQVEPDAILALHNIPGEKLHSLIIRDGAFTASVKSIIIHLNGKTAHAAEPENGINPALAIAELTQLGEELTNNDVHRDDFKLITPIHIEMGEVAYGISAGSAVVRWTMRTWTKDVMSELESALLEGIRRIAAKHDLEVSWDWTQVFKANQNNPQLIEQIRTTGRELNLEVQERNFPFKWGEDFGAFTQKYAGAMFGLGSGVDQPALHNPDFDFPDELIETGKDVFVNMALRLLND